MKRYKLKRDLPTFKAGDNFHIGYAGELVWENPHGDDVIACCARILEKFPNILADWFEEIPEVPKTVWDLEKGDWYYVINRNGNIDTNQWDEFGFGESYREIGNAFLDRGEANKEIARRKARVILQRDTKGFEPDWKNSDEKKYFVDWSYYKNDFHIEVCTYTATEQMPFGSEEDAEASIKAHEKEWKTYLGVED